MKSFKIMGIVIGLMACLTLRCYAKDEVDTSHLVCNKVTYVTSGEKMCLSTKVPVGTPPINIDAFREFQKAQAHLESTETPYISGVVVKTYQESYLYLVSNTDSYLIPNKANCTTYHECRVAQQAVVSLVDYYDERNLVAELKTLSRAGTLVATLY